MFGLRGLAHNGAESKAPGACDLEETYDVCTANVTLFDVMKQRTPLFNLTFHENRAPGVV